MKTKDIHLLDLDFEYKLWKNRMMFIHADLGIMLERARELIADGQPDRIPPRALIVKAESLRNQANSCISKIKVREEEAAYYARDYPIDQKHQHYADHEQIRKEADSIWNEFTGLMEGFITKYS